MTKVALDPPKRLGRRQQQRGTETIGRIEQAVGVVEPSPTAAGRAVRNRSFTPSWVISSCSPDTPMPTVQCGRSLRSISIFWNSARWSYASRLCFDRAEVDLERLVARQEVRLDELGAHIVARLLHRVAAKLHAGGEVELLGVAEQVAVVPAGIEVDAKIGRIGRADVDRMQRPLGHVDRRSGSCRRGPGDRPARCAPPRRRRVAARSARAASILVGLKRWPGCSSRRRRT